MKSVKLLVLSLLVLSINICVGQEEEYEYSQDSKRQDGVPKGTVTKHVYQSKIYKDTYREYYVYVPVQYNPDQPAALMVFQDGHAYVKEEGSFRVPIVFDTTIQIYIKLAHLTNYLNQNLTYASSGVFLVSSLKCNLINCFFFLNK